MTSLATLHPTEKTHVALTCNVTGKVRRVFEGGREYYVAPLTMLVPGVLNGSKGALYYPPDECKATTSHWHDIPITVYHPISNGTPCSASDEGVLEAQGIGSVRHPRFTNKLQAQGWFDVEKVRNADKALMTEHRILPRLEKGQPIELSTGLYTDNEEASPGACWNGRGYDYTARNYRPDHLAVLPDQIGACSINDGCGVCVNESDSEQISGQRVDGERVESISDTLTKKACKCGKAGGSCTCNTANPLANYDYVINPAVSEAQRRFLYATKGEDWVKAHGFDNKGSLPDSVEPEEKDKKGKKKTENSAKETVYSEGDPQCPT